jgi:hypothetical protein
MFAAMSHKFSRVQRHINELRSAKLLSEFSGRQDRFAVFKLKMEYNEIKLIRQTLSGSSTTVTVKSSSRNRCFKKNAVDEPESPPPIIRKSVRNGKSS